MKGLTQSLFDEHNISAGVFFYAKSTGRYLYLMRNDLKSQYCWGIPGGKIEHSESLYDGIKRECIEEVGMFPDNIKLIPIQKFDNNNFTYHTFFASVNDEFIPILNHEHCGYSWLSLPRYPKPLHPGLFNTINFGVVQEKLDLLTKKAP